MTPRDAIVVGAGHNGLVAACLLARAGLRPLVVERRSASGGLASTEELHPGFHFSAMPALGPLRPGLAEELQLDRHGYSAITPEARVFLPAADGKALCIYNDSGKTAAGLSAHSAKDSACYAEFAATFEKFGKLLRPLLSMTPPSIDNPAAGELWSLAMLGRRFRGLGKKDAYRLLRWGPMAAADLASEWFETETLRAAVAARGIHSSMAGPWSAGTCLGLMMQAALDGSPYLCATSVRGGAGALGAALSSAAKSAGAEIRTDAGVGRILVTGGNASGVVLENGEEISSRIVVSAADPKTTYLKLVDPVDLDPDFLHRLGNYRSTGCAAKIHYALSGLPKFAGAAPDQLTGRIQIGHSIDDLERAFDDAKYGEFSAAPYLDVTIPSLCDASLAPAGAHVLSAHVQFAPYKLRQGDWSQRREALAEAVEKSIEAHAQGFRALIVARTVLTPADLESRFGLWGGHLNHGEMALDQLFTFRPLHGFARYRSPIPGLYLCGAGTHPGGGLTGASGANAAREILKDRRS